MHDILLGLIGDNILHSRSPRLHILAGQQNGLDIQYNRLFPKKLDQKFEDTLTNCIETGYRGVNVTFPYKELAANLVATNQPIVKKIGAINTVIFSPEGPLGYNTDYSGFIAAYRSVMHDTPPGPTCLIGTGGVGRAVAFGLVALGVQKLILVDHNLDKARALATAIRSADFSGTIEVSSDAATAIGDAHGIINCTPVGMTEHPGTPIPGHYMRNAKWAFDAVYTPVRTEFLLSAEANNLKIISGYELFINQGLDAWALFADLPLDQKALRTALQSTETPS